MTPVSFRRRHIQNSIDLRDVRAVSQKLPGDQLHTFLSTTSRLDPHASPALSPRRDDHGRHEPRDDRRCRPRAGQRGGRRDRTRSSRPPPPIDRSPFHDGPPSSRAAQQDGQEGARPPPLDYAAEGDNDPVRAFSSQPPSCCPSPHLHTLPASRLPTPFARSDGQTRALAPSHARVRAPAPRGTHRWRQTHRGQLYAEFETGLRKIVDTDLRLGQGPGLLRAP